MRASPAAALAAAIAISGSALPCAGSANADPLVHTYSIVARDPATGEMGVAVQPPIRPDTVVVVEKWRDLAALKAHSAAPHMAVYRTKAKHLIQSVSLQILDPVTPA